MSRIRRILVIDDDQDFCAMMQDILLRTGYEASFSTAPIISVEEALAGGYDLITLDIKMPAFDGTEIAELFQDHTLKTPVLVISGYLTSSIVEQLRRAGIHHILPKPFENRELLRAVEKALAE